MPAVWGCTCRAMGWAIGTNAARALEDDDFLYWSIPIAGNLVRYCRSCGTDRRLMCWSIPHCRVVPSTATSTRPNPIGADRSLCCCGIAPTAAVI